MNQFRLYGKNDGEEGTGLCLVFNRDFFAAPGEVSLIAVKREEEQFPKEEMETGHKLPLYWVLYYDCESGHVYYTPACTEHSLNRELEMTEDSFRKSDRKRVKNIGESLKRIRYYFKSISKEYQHTALEMLIYLRHLVKDAAFKDEKELRILSLHPYNDSSLKILTGKNCLSVNYLPVIHDKEEYLNCGTEIEGFYQSGGCGQVQAPSFRRKEGSGVSPVTDAFELMRRQENGSEGLPAFIVEEFRSVAKGK